MKMQLSGMGALILGAGMLLAAAAGAAVAQQGGEMDQQKMLEAYMKAGAPGEHHKRLNAMVGEWDLEISHWFAPGAPPAVSKGESSAEWIMDGRFVQEKVEGDMGDMAPGMEFHGTNVVGYDNMKKKYVSTWIDSMSTAILLCEGEFDTAKNALVQWGEAIDPMTGEMKKFRWVSTFSSPRKWTSDYFVVKPDGSEFKEMSIAYTKK